MWRFVLAALTFVAATRRCLSPLSSHLWDPLLEGGASRLSHACIRCLGDAVVQVDELLRELDLSSDEDEDGQGGVKVCAWLVQRHERNLIKGGGE